MAVGWRRPPQLKYVCDTNYEWSLLMSELRLSKEELLTLLLYSSGATGVIGEPVVGRIRLMKLLFLAAMDPEIQKTLSEVPKFEPYKYGPFDMEVFDAVEALVELGIIERSGGDDLDEDVEVSDDVQSFRLTEKGLSVVAKLQSELPEGIRRRIRNVKAIYNRMPLVELLHFVYSRYPKYVEVKV